MKKCLILIGVCLVIGISQNVHLRWNTPELGKLEITLENIEALADTENPDKLCRFLGSLDCPNYPVKVLYIQ